MTDYQFDPADVQPFDGAPSEPGDSAGPDESPVAGPEDPLFGGVNSSLNVETLAAELIEPAVRKAVSKRVDDVATQAVAAALTPEMVDRLRADADEAARTLVHARGRGEASDGPRGDQSSAPAEDAARLYYGSTNEFVRDCLRHIYRRRIDGQRTFWSPQWWKFGEAVARLEALWLAWEHLRLDTSTGPSVWWRDHADPHMAVLMSSVGPFSKERGVEVTVLEPLPYEEPPDGLFPDVREVAI